MKLKHNKKRNTAFLYESLVKEITKAVVNNDTKHKNILVSIVKEHFSKGSNLREELDLFKVLSETKHVDLYTAERLITETKKQYDKLDKKAIFEKQSELINQMNKAVGKSAFAAFVPNYRHLATISQLFVSGLNVKEQVLLERNLIGAMIAKPGQAVKAKEMPHVDGLVFKTIIENFNKKYDGQLLAEQKELLNRYILSFNASEVEFKVYLNEELARVKEEIAKLSEDEIIANDMELSEKLERVKEVVGRFQMKKINTEMIEKVLQVQKLIKECSE
jgi:hypothetical protein